MKIIFAVEDEENIRELYKCALPNYDVRGFETGKEMKEAIETTCPDLIILDLMLPDISGHELLLFLKGNWRYKDIPVIVVSAKGDEVSKVNLLNLGADDYLSKPFGIMELQARINANLRKTQKHSLSFLNIIIDENRREVFVAEEKIITTLKEYELLKYMILNANSTCERDLLLKNVWNMEYEGESRTLDVHIKSLREKLAKSDAEIETIRGVGYMLTLKA